MTTASPTANQIAVSLSPQQRELIEQAAARCGQNLDDFVASVLIESAEQTVQGVAESNGARCSAAERNGKRQFEHGELLESSNRVILDDRALISWRMTPSFAQEHIRQTLEALAGRSPSDWPRDMVQLWRPAEQLYALHTMIGADHVLIFFQPEGTDIRLLDMALKELIDRYFASKNEARNG